MLRSIIEAGKGARLVCDLTFDNDENFGPSFLLRLGDIYTEFWHMSGTTTLTEYCAAVVNRQLVALLPKFELSQDYFGFGGIFQSDPPVINDYMEYRAVLYPPKSPSKIDSGLHAQAIAATLSVLFRKAEFHPTEPVNSGPRQLFYGLSGTTKGGGGHYLNVVLAKQTCNFVASQSQRASEGALDAMMLTWSATHEGMPTKRSDGFRAEFGDGRFGLSIPDSSGTNLSLPANEASSRYWSLSSHNVDNASAQLQLLAGLAAVCGEIREQEIQRGEI